MRHIATLALLGIFGVVPVVSQQAQPAMTDSQTLQAILVEMRGLHNDVRLSQTTQILLTELEVQQTAVTRAMEKRDDARNKVSNLQNNEKNMTAQIARYDDPTDTTIDAQQRKQMAMMIENFRSNIVAMKSQVLDATNELQDAENTLRKEQDTLASIQDQLNAVVKKLQPVTQ
jgi:predicted  nucleic acid-binding Zn-ribbon protein